MAKLEQAAPSLRHRRTKIVATLGPASSSPSALRALLEAGVDVVRLNFSHGDVEEKRLLAKRVRTTAKRLGRHVAILGDLSGPKMRTGRFEGGHIELREGSTVVVTSRSVVGTDALIPSQYRQLPNDVKRGEMLLLDDGNLRLQVDQVRGQDVRCTVIDGGILKDNKGINLPGSEISAPALTAKDRRDAVTAVEMELDYLALSFVRRASDVEALARLLARAGRKIPIIAKIEKPQALEQLDEIIHTAYGIMVARGDLGVELEPERVPIVQREIVRRCVAADRPVIVATQMLESMIDKARPTRAEVNDVASAAFTSADAVMLSAETATGKYPVGAVKMMDRILREVEGHLWQSGGFQPGGDPSLDSSDAARIRAAIGRAASHLSWDLKVRCIVVPSQTGTSARAVSSDRPEAPVVLVSRSLESCRRGALYWGVLPVHAPEIEAGTPFDELGRALAVELEFAKPGHHILVVRGFHPDLARSRPTVTVVTV